MFSANLTGLVMLSAVLFSSLAVLATVAMLGEGAVQGFALFFTGWVGHSALMFALDVWKIWTLENR